jgi:hypothetical protein
MPIKRPDAPPAPTSAIKRVEQPPAGGGHLTKEDLLGRLLIVTLTDYDPDYQGAYGTTARAVVDIIEVGGEEAREQGLWWFSNLAKQIGAGLKPGETGLGRIETGTTKSGTGTWWGFQFSTSDHDYAAADQVPLF